MSTTSEKPGSRPRQMSDRRRNSASDGRSLRPDISDPSFPLGSVPNIQVVDRSGRVTNAERDPGLGQDELLRVYRAMVLTRKFDIRMLNMQRQGEMGTFAPGYGQEATQIGQVYPLGDADWFSPSYRSFGAQIWRGWPMDHLMKLWGGYHEGFAPPRGVNDLPFSIVIGSHVPVATGVAMGMRYRDDKSVMVVNFGDGAFSQGAVSEALNFAAVFDAPVVFVCENNGYAISTPIEKQSGVFEFSRRGVGYGMPAMRVDGNDVLAMISCMQEAVDRARDGGGPTLIEAITYRMGVHTTADDPKVYREDAEVEAFEAKCPIARFERYLRSRDVLADADIEQIAAACEQDALDARAKFRAEAEVKPREAFDYMYHEMPPELAEQQREYFEKLQRKGVQ